MSDELIWVGSDGPVVLLPLARSKSWYGAAVPCDILEEGEDYDEDDVEIMPDGTHAVPLEDFDPDDPKSHYEMACALDEDEPAGVVAEFFLAVNSTGEQVAWWPQPDGGWLVRWICAESEEDAVEALKHPPQLDWEECGTWTLEADGAVLLAAADTVEEQAEDVKVEVDLPAGTYALSGAELSVGDTELAIVRLKRV